MKDYTESLDATRNALYELGPAAVATLKNALESGIQNAGPSEVAVAKEILDRMGLNRQGSL